MSTFQKVVFGVKISGTSSCDPDVMDRAIEYVNEHAERLKNGSPSWVNKDQILALIAVGIADDLLQLQDKMAQLNARLKDADVRLASLLERIDAISANTDTNSLGSA